MKRKNLFLIPALFLFSILCFFNVSCFSGFQEKGEVTITFSESTLRQIMARGGDISAEQEGEDTDFELPSFISGNNKLLAKYSGMEEGGPEVFVLYVFTDNTYAVYSSSLMNQIDFSKYEGITPAEIMTNPEFSELYTNPYSILNPAIVSKGTWKQNDSEILITETHYKSAASGNLIKVEKPTVNATISEDASSFSVPSASGYSINFFASPDNPEIDIPDIKEENYPKLMVGLEVGGKNYVKLITIDERIALTKKIVVTYSDMPVGLTAKATAIMYFDDPYEGKQIFAKGESEEFVIQTGINSAKIIMHEYNGGDEPPVEEKILYSATSHISEEYPEAKLIFNGTLYFMAYSDNTYEIKGDVYDQDGYPLESKIFAQGTWEFSAAEDSVGYLLLTETDYFDFEQNQLISGADGGLTIDLSKMKFNYNGWSAVELEFIRSGYEPDYTSFEVSFEPIPVENVDGTWQLEKVTRETGDVFVAPEGWDSYIWYLDGLQVSSSEDKENEYILNGVSGGTHKINCLMKRTVDGEESTLYLTESFFVAVRSAVMG